MSLLFFFAHFACNQCKQLCNDMAALAESCDYEVTSEMIRACKEQQSGKSFAEKGECRTVRPALEEEWDCDELAVSFNESSSTASDESGN